MQSPPKPQLQPMNDGLPIPQVASSELFDALLAFTGTEIDFATLLLASVFSNRLLLQTVIFQWEGEAAPPKVRSSFPPLAAGARLDWLQAVVDSLPISDSHTKIIPRNRLPGGRSLPTKLGVKSLDADGGDYLAFEMKHQSQVELPAFMMNLDMLGALWRSFKQRVRREDADALAPAVSLLSAVNPYKQFHKYTMSLCNETASRFGCDRVSLGILKGRYVRVAAISHTEKFAKGMDLVQSIEAAMEECLDQDAEVVFPDPPGSTFVTRAAAELSGRFDGHCIVSVPIRDGEIPAAVLTLERSSPIPPGLGDIRLLRLAADLVAPRLLELHTKSRWFGARFALWLREKLGAVLGPKHTWAKLAALLCMGAILFFIFARGTYSVEGTFVTKPVEQRVVAAPYDGFIAEVNVRPGEKVEAGATLMAELETAELTSELAMKKAEMSAHLKDAALARRENKFAEAQAAEARAEQAEAECDLLADKLDKAKLYSPLTGVVLSGDLTTRVGAPVKLGETLFEIAPVTEMEADLYVPEDEIADVAEGQTGELVAAGRPDEKIRFEVVRITPLAELVKQQNVFRVRVRLIDAPAWMLPGLEGVAKVGVEERLLARIWSRRAVNWVKMKLWRWWW